VSLVLERIGKRVGGERHLADIALELRPGTLAVLLGPTLAGKTSLMRVMAGLDRPTEGRVIEGGRDVTGVAPRRRRVAMVYQQFINYPSMTVFENIASPLRRQGVRGAEVERRVREAAARVRIDPLLGRLPAELSGGQQQRCAIARALAKDARLLLLDEPLVNLDYKLREELREELQTIFKARDAIVVYATTEPLEALIMGGMVVVMDEGRVLQHGPCLEVFHRPATARVAEVFSDPPINTVAGRIEAGRAVIGEGVMVPATGHLAELPAGSYRFGVRSNHLGIGPPRPDEAALAGTVELAEISGSETFVHVRHGPVSWVVQQAGVHAFALGQEVEMRLDPRSLFVFGADGSLVAAPPPAIEA